MQWFYNLKIAKKLVISFIAVAMIAGFVGFIGIINIRKIDGLDTEMYEKHTATIPNIANVAMAYEKELITLKDLHLEKDTEKKKQLIESFKELDLTISENMKSFDAGIKSTEGRENFNVLSQTLNNFYVFRDEVLSYIQSNQMEESYKLLSSGRGIQIEDEVQKRIDELLRLKEELAKQTSDANTKTANSATTTMIIVIIIGMVIAVLFGLYISRIISGPVNKMVKAADKLAIGDVNVNVEANTKDEIGSLAEAFARMVANIREQAAAAEKIASGDLTTEITIKSESDLLGKKLAEMVAKNNEILTDITAASEQVAIGSRQLSESSIALSEGATEQATSIEELTASLEEIASQTDLNAENASQAKQLAEDAKVNAVQGNNQMMEMLGAMEQINESSSNISKIIKVIDEIAFQTNILALNAAVEAARAGQHGKGFAVVAEEVRNLAARSANAAKETTDMIEGSIKKVEGGTRIAKDTAEALNKIVSSSNKMADIVKDIANASNEQAIGIKQVNQAIMQVSQVVQTNSATSEESAAASEQLSSQAGFLKGIVSRFKLKQSVKTYDNIDELNPEVLKMLSNMSKKGKINVKQKEQSVTSEPKIFLSDQEFGKYL